MSQYIVRFQDAGKEVNETVEVDTEKQTEKFHIPETNSSNAGEVHVVYDFKRVINLLHLYLGHLHQELYLIFSSFVPALGTAL